MKQEIKNDRLFFTCAYVKIPPTVHKRNQTPVLFIFSHPSQSVNPTTETAQNFGSNSKTLDTIRTRHL